MTLSLHPRLTLDLAVRDIAYAVNACARRPDAAREARALESDWAPAGDGLAALSVRSAFDLYLSALALPYGSEVLLSGVTIADMVRVVREHGLVPVPVDIEFGTLFPSPADCERAWSAKSRVLVVAQLFGGRNDLAPCAEWAHSRGLFVVEDCAQGFIAPTDRGSPSADASFFSFGSIKTLTALGGALVRVADVGVLARMRAAQEQWPVHSRRKYAAKIVRAALLLIVQQPRVYALIARLCALLGRDFDRLIQSSVRGFPVPPGGSLVQLLRNRPCGALVAMLRYRLRTFDPQRLAARARQGERVVEALRPAAQVFGAEQQQRTHWLVAIVSTDRDAAVRCGRIMGLDVAPGASSIVAVPRPAERPDLAPLRSEAFLDRMLFVPAHAAIPDKALADIAEIAAPYTLLARVARERPVGRAVRCAVSVLVLLLLGASVSHAQVAGSDTPKSQTPILGDMALVPTAFWGRGLEARSPGLELGIAWLGLERTRGWRLGLTVALLGECAERCAPLSAPQILQRHYFAIMLERERRWPQGRLIPGIAAGAGLGRLDTDVIRPSAEGVDLSASFGSGVAVLSTRASLGVLFHMKQQPIELTAGLGVRTMIGARLEEGPLPDTGPASSRGGRMRAAGSMFIGFRAGVLSALF